MSFFSVWAEKIAISSQPAQILPSEAGNPSRAATGGNARALHPGWDLPSRKPNPLLLVAGVNRRKNVTIGGRRQSARRGFPAAMERHVPSRKPEICFLMFKKNASGSVRTLHPGWDYRPEN
ncbi:MAG: hypothetical protein LBQ54_13670 [Planctomycetaceae bacterium]|nr:hypothetical protein [Planctomycetaceae bacterium]